ncbi:MAG: MFS transporter [Candidatus Thorarchaeota archaeon]|jgi:MFS family permease
MAELTGQSENRSVDDLDRDSAGREAEHFEDPNQLHPEPESKPSLGFIATLKVIFSWRNYAIYLATAWIWNAFTYIVQFFNLYLRALGWDFLLIGIATSVPAFVGAGSRLISGYVGDTVDRKKLAVVAMFITAIYYLIIGLFTDVLLIFAAMLILSTANIARSGSSAYIMDNVPKEHSGLALSLFTAGKATGIATMIAFVLLVPLVGFEESVRIIYFVAGIFLIGCTVIRQILLTPSSPPSRSSDRSILKDFILENKRAAKLLAATVPGVLTVVALDALSDSIFKFGALIYTNEVLEIKIPEIIIMVLTTIIISVPLLLIIGRVSDRGGTKKASVLVYSIMPICAALLIIAPVFPNWAPSAFIDAAEIIMPGLGAIFTIPFLAIVLKYVNDSLWAIVLLVLIQKNLPRTDTAKILAVFWFTVYFIWSFGPLIGGLVFTFLDPSMAFFLVLILNFVIILAIIRNGFAFDTDNQIDSSTPVDVKQE